MFRRLETRRWGLPSIENLPDPQLEPKVQGTTKAPWTKHPFLDLKSRLFVLRAARGRIRALGFCACAPGRRCVGEPAPAAGRLHTSSMQTTGDTGGAGGEGPRELALCVLCGLPAAGKSTFARALGHQLRQERGWAVGVLSYDDVLPDAPLDGACARPPVSSRGGAAWGRGTDGCCADCSERLLCARRCLCGRWRPGRWTDERWTRGWVNTATSEWTVEICQLCSTMHLI
jgi:hypothetical protein